MSGFEAVNLEEELAVLTKNEEWRKKWALFFRYPAEMPRRKRVAKQDTKLIPHEVTHGNR